MDMRKSVTFGFVKSGLDAHTLGINHITNLLEECGLTVHLAKAEIARAIDNIQHESHFLTFKNWLVRHNITHLGFSYRLDPEQAVEILTRLIKQIESDSQLSLKTGGLIQKVSFAGLPESCALVANAFGERIVTFRGDETPKESLLKLGLPERLIPRSIQKQSDYDELRLRFSKTLIGQEKHCHIQSYDDYTYPDYGTAKDHLIKRLDAALANQLPLIRVHAGPYMKDRAKALALFSDWLKNLAKNRLLDIVSVGSSQLSQSHFGKSWDDLPNGGGVPINTEMELRTIHQDASPMLVRTYSATNNICHVAHLLERNLNMAWHALSIWWFNRLDGRGPLGLRQSIAEHIETIKYVAQIRKPFEPNTPHHFAFRGGDDLTYLASAFLAANVAKRNGIHYFVLQNMLNTPKSTWGLRDLAKSRALLQLVRRLEDRNFRVIYQPRAGLDYFSPDVDKAKIQLAAVSALMSDVEPKIATSPEIIHVVSYSEALFLAHPDVIDESIRIAKASLVHYPQFRRNYSLDDLILNQELAAQTQELVEEAVSLTKDMEKRVKNLYSAEGLEAAFRMGYLPVPYLWECRDEYANAVSWTTKLIDGGVYIVDDSGRKMSIQDRLRRTREMNPKIY
jgi:hypothetical protein